MARKTEQAPEEPTLEQAVQRLDSIVEELESGEADLEKSITLFEEGQKLGKLALIKLDALERRIELVTADDGEELKTEEFLEEDDAEY